MASNPYSYAGWQPGAGATTTKIQDNSSPTSGLSQLGGTGNYANPAPNDQPWVDYVNADGTPHINYKYGQASGPNGNTGRGSGQQQQQSSPMYDMGYSGQFPAGSYGGPANGAARPGAQYGAMGQGSGNPYDPNQLAYQQFQQNTNQYNQDFTEAQRRWNAQFGQSNAQNAWQQDFSNRQQSAAEQQAALAAQQWNQQFGYTQQRDQQNYGLQAQQLQSQTQQWQAQLGQSQAELAANQNRWNQDRAAQDALARWQQQQQAQQQQWQTGQQLGFSREELAANQAKWSRDAGLQQQQINNQNFQATQQLAQQRQDAAMKDALARWQTGQQLGFSQQELAANQGRWNADRAQQQQQFAQQLGMSQQELQAKVAMAGQQDATQRWQTQQDIAYKDRALQQNAALEAQRLGISTQEMLNTDKYRMAQVALDKQKLVQEMSLQTRGYDLQSQQMAQNKELELAKMAQAKELATMQAYGRNQAPVARYIRNW